MRIQIKPKDFKGHSSWDNKMQGVVLVEKEEDIEALWKALCAQDDYWEAYKDLIKVSPKEIESISELKSLCSYTGKTDIYELSKLQEKFSFIIYQYYGHA